MNLTAPARWISRYANRYDDDGGSMVIVRPNGDFMVVGHVAIDGDQIVVKGDALDAEHGYTRVVECYGKEDAVEFYPTYP